MSVNIKISVASTSFKNKYPKIKIQNNDILLDDLECTNKFITLNYDVDPLNINELSIELYNKSFGDNNIWDVDSTSELKLSITDIKFNDVSVKDLLYSTNFVTNWTPWQLQLQSPEFINEYSEFRFTGSIVFNGIIKFLWKMPIYNFIIEQKFKKPYDPSIAYFSNTSELFHYEHGLKYLTDIKKLLEFHG